MQPLIPEPFISAFAVATVFVVMFHLGLGILSREVLWVWRRPALMLKALFAVLVAVPVVALVVARALDLPHAAEVGIVLMAISPGAPIALQRSLGAGARRSFAPGLQITVALAAVASMPLFIAVLDVLYGATASVSPWQIMRQVAIVQLLPLALGVVTARHLPRLASRVAPLVDRAWKVLFLALVALAVVGFWRVMLATGLSVALAAALTTLGALVVGHWFGGPDPRAHRGRDHECGAQPRARAAGRGAEPCAGGGQGDGAHVHGGGGVHGPAVRSRPGAECGPAETTGGR